MLRALAGYFFGGPQDEVPQDQVECETKEVNDWLVVNMPDQPEDNIDLEEENDDDAMEMDDLDDVLWCLSHWFTPEEIFETEQDLEENRIVEKPPTPQIRLLYNKENSPSEAKKCISFNTTGRIENVPHNYWQILPLQARYRKLVEEFQSKYFSDDLKENGNVLKPFWIDQAPKSLLPYENLSGKQKTKELCQRLRERNVKKAIKGSDVTCHPVYSKTYVNHRHPALSPPKTDLLQRIKELEPEQRATQNAMKKHISKGQINRQNKNYIYDTSTKKNRRKNLQRNPSGANNNRKCCY